VDHDLEVFPGPAAVAARAAGYAGGLARAAVVSLVLADAQEAGRVRGAAPAHRNGDQG
jgi:hypothetical protein